jgi:hypothetical protein
MLRPHNDVWDCNDSRRAGKTVAACTCADAMLYRELGLTGGVKEWPKEALREKAKKVAAKVTTPATHVQKKSKPKLLLNENSSLDELRAFIDRHKLPVSKAVGGHGGRTKKQMLREIAAELEQEQDAPVPCEDPPDAGLGMCFWLRHGTGGRRRRSVRAHVLFLVEQAGGIGKLLQTSVGGLAPSRMVAEVRSFEVDAPSSKGLAHLLGTTTRGLAGAMFAGEVRLATVALLPCRLTVCISLQARIVREFEGSGTAEDIECLDYVRNRRAGSDPQVAAPRHPM